MSVLAIHSLRYQVRRHFWTAPQRILNDVSFNVEAGEKAGQFEIAVL